MAGAISPRALVIGGSLGGLFAANLLLRGGWDVHLFEHSREDLVGRGAGIITHPELFACLARLGIAIDGSFGVDIPERIALDRSGRIIGSLAVKQCLTTWGRLYELLRAAFPGDRYHLGHTLQRVDAGTGGVAATFANGVTARGELLIGADGIRSAVRAQLLNSARPHYAGYVAWRGLADECTLTPSTHADLFPKFAFSLAEREQMLGYPVAGFTRSTRAGERCYNFVWYRPADEHRALTALCTDVNGRQHDMSVPPPLIRPEIVEAVRRAADDLLAPQFSEVVRRAPQPFFQAIFDLESSQITFGRIALLGDAAFVARPHCGMGVTKAAGDAMVLDDALRAADNDVPAALLKYESARQRFGSAVVAHGRHLGSYLEGQDTGEAHQHHTAEAVMREIAVTREFV
ncbi:MAG: FAD-dependent oxidoreductase [Betaproteobacteria bacterium]|jgi:2-polyprenyl-6-methoxyphenol hydroxylase-like FAD-dependent oxidoreductase|nr:FAD-dependent oxidoreductase [Betaproteobacteria bacterium]